MVKMASMNNKLQNIKGDDECVEEKESKCIIY